MINGRSPRPADRSDLQTVPMVSAVDGLSHQVHDDSAIPGLLDGIYIAVCGLEVLPAALGCRSDRRCPRCLAGYELASPATGLGSTSRRATRRRIAQWLRHWCRSSQDTTTVRTPMGSRDASAGAVSR